MDKGEKIVYVEFTEGRPHSVVTGAPHPKGGWYGDIYDVDWCKRDGEFYSHQSGSGSVRGVSSYLETKQDHTTWWAGNGFDPGDVSPVAAACRLKRLPRGYGLKVLAEIIADDTPTEYCSTCDDYLPTEKDHPCDHMRWCEEVDWTHLSTPDERCPIGCNECLKDGYPTEAVRWPLALQAEGYGTIAEPWSYDPRSMPWPRRSSFYMAPEGIMPPQLLIVANGIAGGYRWSWEEDW